jgi:hypothetical protein
MPFESLQYFLRSDQPLPHKKLGSKAMVLEQGGGFLAKPRLAQSRRYGRGIVASLGQNWHGLCHGSQRIALGHRSCRHLHGLRLAGQHLGREGECFVPSYRA